jgi:hypothetical protein
MEMIMSIRGCFVLCTLSVVIFGGCSKSPTKPYRVGLVNFVTGKVEITGPGGKVFPAQVGTPIDEGMKIKTTGKNSLCEIYIRDTALKIFADSVLDISRLRYAAQSTGEQTVMTLGEGRLFLRIVKKLSKDDQFGVKTPLCVAAVRGTEFFVTKHDISCLDGKVEVKSVKTKNAQAVVIGDGESAQPSTGAALKKKELTAEAEKKLAADSNVRDIEKKNRELFDRLENGDKDTLSELRIKIRSMSGETVKEKKEDKPDVDLFFFKS